MIAFFLPAKSILRSTNYINTRTDLVSPCHCGHDFVCRIKSNLNNDEGRRLAGMYDVQQVRMFPESFPGTRTIPTGVQISILSRG